MYKVGTTSLRLIISLSLPGPKTTISSPTAFSSAKKPTVGETTTLRNHIVLCSRFGSVPKCVLAYTHSANVVQPDEVVLPPWGSRHGMRFGG